MPAGATPVMVVNSAGQLGRVAEESVEPYGARACACAKHVRKGSRVMVDGELAWRDWTDQQDKRREAVTFGARQVLFEGARSRTDSGDGARHWASDVIGSRDLSHRRFDDGDVLLRRSAADSDAGDHLALVGERDAAADRGVVPGIGRGSPGRDAPLAAGPSASDHQSSTGRQLSRIPRARRHVGGLPAGGHDPAPGAIRAPGGAPMAPIIDWRILQPTE
jgi:single-stranded DNA-binding protein